MRPVDSGDRDGPLADITLTVRRVVRSGGGRPELGRGLVAGAAVALPVLVGVLAGHQVAGTQVARGALVLAMVDGAYPHRARRTVLGVTAAGAVVSTFVGTVAGLSVATAVACVVAWTAASAFTGTYGPRYEGVGVACTVTLLFGLAIPAHPAVAAGRAGLTLLGAAVAVTAFLAPWPGRRWWPADDAASEVMAAASQVLAALSAAVTAAPATTFRPWTEAVGRLRRAAATARDVAQATYGGTGGGRPLDGLADGAERLGVRGSAAFESMVLVRGPGGAGLPAPVTAAVQVVLAALADRTALAAATVRVRPSARARPGRDGPDRAADRVEAALDALADVHQQYRRPDLAPGEVPRLGDVDLLVRAMTRLADAVGVLVSAADGKEPHLYVTGDRPRGPAALVDPVRAQCHLDAPRARLALRLAVTCGVAELVVLATHVNHGLWLVMTIMAVLRVDRGATHTRAVQQIAGTLVGCAVAAVLLAALHNGVVLALCVGACMALAVALRRVNYSYWSMLFAPSVLLLVDLGQRQPWRVALVRLGLTVAGGLAGLAADRWLWPTRQEHALWRAAAADLTAVRAYLATVADGVEAGAADHPRLVAARRAAEQAHTRLQDALALLGDDPGADRLSVAAAVDVAGTIGEILRTVRAAAVFVLATFDGDAAPSPWTAEPQARRAFAGFAARALAELRLLGAGGAAPGAAGGGTDAVVVADAATPVPVPADLVAAVASLAEARAAAAGGGPGLEALRLQVRRWHGLLRFSQRMADELGRLAAECAVLHRATGLA